jgi:hypothetical protein
LGEQNTNMAIVIVDVESDGPAPGIFSMVSFGAIFVDKTLDKTFYGQVRPLVNAKYDPAALKISGHTREEHEKFDEPVHVMKDFATWLSENNTDKYLTFMSDNPAFDWQFINFYFHAFYGSNPFGFSARRIGDLYCGLVRDFYANNKWKQFRSTKHTHHPVDDAKGNAEALLRFCTEQNFKLPL